MKDKAKFIESRWIIDRLEKFNFKAYFVGGSVRDYLMERAISDVDITTSALPEDIEKLFEKTLPIGKEHGTIVVIDKGQQYEVTTFRKDGDYIDHRRPSTVEFVDELYEDVARRDFTINAIAMNQHFQLIDYFQGQKDIEMKLIRAVGTPNDRMEEDALRIMRGLRFQSQTGFDIDKETLEAMREKVDLLSFIAIERSVVELKKLIKGYNVGKALITANQINTFKYLPFFNQVKTEIPIVYEANFKLWIAYIVYKFSLQTSSVNSLKLSNAEKKEINQYLRIITFFSTNNINKEELKLLIYEYGNESVIDVITSLEKNPNLVNIIYNPLIMNKQVVNEIYQKLPIRNKRDIDIDGKRLISEFQKQAGPWIKETLQQIEKAIVLKKIKNNEKDIIEWVSEHVEI